MKIAPLADVKARLSAYVEMCAEAPVIVTKNGRPAAVLLTVSDEEELERLVLGHTRRFMAILDSSERRIRKGKGIKHADFWKTVRKKEHRIAALRG